MKKTKLVIASILKPVDDTRMYEKIGVSLSQTNKYEINIIGFSSKNLPQNSTIKFHPIFSFRRLSLQRMFAPLKFFKTLRKIQPKILIIATHEFLLISAVYKILFGCKVIYDIRENYFRNILYTTAFPKPVRPFLACWVRASEYFSKLWVDQYLLAERFYENEFSFSKGSSTIVENKSWKPEEIAKPTPKKEGVIRLLFSGTLAKTTGIFEAISLVKSLYNFDSKIQLIIIGFCHSITGLNEIKNAIKDYPFITLIGGDTLVPHPEILATIKDTDFGIVHYPYNKSTINCIPTKVYEYMAYQLPILTSSEAKWLTWSQTYKACIATEFPPEEPQKLLKKLRTMKFYESNANKDIYWENEAAKIIEVLKKFN